MNNAFKINSLRNSARSNLLYLSKIIKKSNTKNYENFISSVHKFEKKALQLNETNPLLKNSFDYIKIPSKSKAILKSKNEIISKINYCIEHLDNSHEAIAEFGSEKIKKGTNVFVYGYSSSVVSLLLKAKESGKKFEVSTTEIHPLFTGYLLASVLAKHNILVNYYADAALRLALKKADVVLMGTDVISSNNQVYGSIGSELVAEIANKYDVPVYVCADSWKYNSHVASLYEKDERLRSSKEVWSNPPKNIKVLNYGYEKIHPELITGAITEFGIFKPSHLNTEIKRKYSWIS